MKIDFDEEYDVVIIGGGAIGSAIALETSSRNLKTLLCEKNDFSSATSSRSTKLLHGGVRYLEKAITKWDEQQYNLVKEALDERYHFLENANFLANKIQISTPVKYWHEVPYYYVGLKIYDYISGKKSFGSTQFVGKKEFFKNHPYAHKNISGAIRYFDGNFNDCKMVISMIQTAKQYGLKAKNYTVLDSFIYKDKKIIGAKIYDKNENRYFNIKASCVINATGHYVDNIRKTDNEKAKELTQFSKGTHIVVSKDFLPANEGVIVPKTEDGRVLFILPWQEHCLIGTTENSTKFESYSKPTSEEINYLIKHTRKYFNVHIFENDILSAWSGLRTLIKEDGKKDKDIVREDIIDISKSNLVSVAGGKWTTCRKIAYDCVEFAIEKEVIKTNKKSLTKNIKLKGSYEDLKELKKELEKFTVSRQCIDSLVKHYGSEAVNVLKIGQKYDAFEKINGNYPFIKAEILYCVRYEFVKTPLDFLARRIRLAFVNKKECFNTIAYVAKVLKEELKWDEQELTRQIILAQEELNEFF